MDDQLKKIYILLPGDNIFGQEKALIILAKFLIRENYSITFLIHKSWGINISNYLESQGLKYEYLNLGTLWSFTMAKKKPSIIFSNIWSLFTSSWKLYFLIKNKGYKQIITGNITFTIYILPALFLSKTKIIYRHGDLPISHSKFHKIFSNLIFKKSNTHVVNCHFIKNKIHNIIPDNKLKIIYNTSIRETRIVESYISTDKPFILKMLFVGQIAPHKGIILLLEAFEKLVIKYHNVILDIVGGIPGVDSAQPIYIKEILESFINKYPDNIFYHGYQTSLDEFYEGSNLHLCPSIWEDPSPNVIMEAKIFSLPTLAFNVGGISEIVKHNEDGYISKEISSSALLDGMLYYYKNPIFLKNHGENARKNYYRKFGNRRYIEEWIKVLESLEV